MTLVQSALGQSGDGAPSLMRSAALVLGGSLLVAIAAQVSVPFYPVAMTLQTLAVLIVGLGLGARLGAFALLTYLAQGAMGLPVFANGLNGVAFVGPTCGFLFGFVALAWGVGYAADRGWARGVFSTSAICFLGTALLYVPGVAWPMMLAGSLGIDATWVGQGIDYYLTSFVAPFALADAVKAVIAALIIAGGWKALGRKAT